MRRRYELPNNTDYQEESKGGMKPKISIYQIPFYIGIIILLYFGLLFGIVWHFENKLPTPLMVKDEVNYPDAFIAERAIHDLKLLTDLGPRITGGYENDVLAVDYILRQLDMIIHQKNANQKLEIDVQVVSGSYNLESMSVDQINVYAKVQNIVVKLHGTSNATNTSILVNSHFDSSPTSPGGSDDGINVVTMFEILRKLSTTPFKPLHNIIFLFNGAEETPLQASHGFSTQHKWAKECKIIVNLEACGAGGRIILFQTGPETPWLMKYYNMVPHPYGQAAGEEIFQSGLIPSDTDFRIFRDYGKLVGFDFAFYQNGYRYHTKYDDFKNIPHGSYQHVGDNILSLVKNLANAPELLESNHAKGKIIYYDVLGLFMVSYTTTAAIVLNLVSVLVSFGVFLYAINEFKVGYSKSSLKYFGFTIGSVLGGWIISAIIVAVIGFVLDLTNKTMSWYANPWLLVGIYMLPVVGLSGMLLNFISHENLSLKVTSQFQVHIVRLIWTILLLLGTILSIRTVYALVPTILLSSMAFIIIYAIKLQHTRRTWQIVYLISLIIPTILLLYQMLITLKMFVPLTGRMGSDKNPELIIGMMAMFFTIVITSPYVALVTLLRNVKYFLICIGVTFVIFFVIVFTPLGFPYTGNDDSPAPQRYYLMHTRRVFHNENGDVNKTDAGIFFVNMDRNSPNILKPYVKDLAKARSVKEDCDKYILCGLPLSYRLMLKVAPYSTWVPASQPVFHEPLKFTLNSKENLNSTIIRYNVTISGPDRLGAYIVPKSGINLVNISLLDFETERHDHLIAERLYFIRSTSGKEPTDLNFTFDVEVPSSHNGITVDFIATASYVHNNKFVKMPFYEKFLQQFPDWADILPWLGSYYSYVL